MSLKIAIVGAGQSGLPLALACRAGATPSPWSPTAARTSCAGAR